jgi:hypothetical protein
MAMNHRGWVTALVLLLVSMMPIASADLTTETHTLNLVCSSEDCFLSNDAAGDAMISGEERSANPAQPITVNLEFALRPDQVSVALLPSVLETLEIDFRIAEDGLGVSRPDLHVELILGPSTNAWTLAAPSASLGSQSPYRLDNVELDLSRGRILEAGDQVLFRLSFDIDQPVTWELRLAGDSWLDLPIIWSIDAEAANTDEPTSLSEPKDIILIDTTTFGGLMGADVDCYRFDVEEDLSSITVIISWAATPIEVEQNHAVPDLRDANDRTEDDPEVRTRYEGNVVINELRWVEPEGGLHTLCWTGQDDRFQTYGFSGRQALKGIGSTTPEEFTGEATWDGGIAHVGQVEDASAPQGAGLVTMVLAAAGITIALAGYIMPLSSPWLPRFLLPVSIVLLMLGGIISPAVAISNETPNPGEMTFDEVLDQRLERIHQGVLHDDEGEFGPQWYGGFLGVPAGERLQMMLTIESAHPLGDGRWQIQAEELAEVDFDRLIFGKLNEINLGKENQVKFILRSGRLLALDLLLLEALLVVDEEPRGDIVHIEWTMTSAPGMGALSTPAWTSRPDSVSPADWEDLTRAVQPELLTISFCDCGIDGMELSVRPSDIYANDLITPGGIVTSNGLIPHDFWIAMLGLAVLGMAAYVEKERREKALVLADEMLDEW